MADVASIWTTKEIIGSIIATGVVSASASSVIDFFRARSARRRDKVYLCMRIAAVLEAYAVNCAAFLQGTSALYEETKSPSPGWMPDAPVYPDDVDWKSIEPGTAYKVISFLNECLVHGQDATFSDHFENNPFKVEDAAKKTGTRAYELANVLRAIAGLHPPDLGRALDPLFKK